MDNYYLVHWPDEESVSVVSGDTLSSDKIGENCKVKVHRKEYVGKILAKGKQAHICTSTRTCI